MSRGGLTAGGGRGRAGAPRRRRSRCCSRWRSARLLLAGLFNFSLVFLAAIFGVLQYLDQLGLVDWDRLVTAERAKEAAASSRCAPG